MQPTELEQLKYCAEHLNEAYKLLTQLDLRIHQASFHFREAKRLGELTKALDSSKDRDEIKRHIEWLVRHSEEMVKLFDFNSIQFLSNPEGSYNAQSKFVK